MEPVNLLVVERGADWKQWSAVTKLLGNAVFVLIQQGDESSAAFRKRIKDRLRRAKAVALNGVVLLRGKRASASRRARFHRRLLVKLGRSAKNGLMVYPRVAPLTRAPSVAV
ncbi:MAG TPA: hypothetical protein VFN67_09940 [Polyangiales bacterium]|nr:hypothetical protein [Polyangiales bacterium]